jgi:hypothetical protein
MKCATMLTWNNSRETHNTCHTTVSQRKSYHPMIIIIIYISIYFFVERLIDLSYQFPKHRPLPYSCWNRVHGRNLPFAKNSVANRHDERRVSSRRHVFFEIGTLCVRASSAFLCNHLPLSSQRRFFGSFVPDLWDLSAKPTWTKVSHVLVSDPRTLLKTRFIMSTRDSVCFWFSLTWRTALIPLIRYHAINSLKCPSQNRIYTG